MKWDVKVEPETRLDARSCLRGEHKIRGSSMPIPDSVNPSSALLILLLLGLAGLATVGIFATEFAYLRNATITVVSAGLRLSGVPFSRTRTSPAPARFERATLDFGRGIQGCAWLAVDRAGRLCSGRMPISGTRAPSTGWRRPRRLIRPPVGLIPIWGLSRVRLGEWRGLRPRSGSRYGN
jgi:hypothetical protein